ncbi:TetR family transcriptional regulator [Acetobacter indonesiensis NRIC 0313]|uniref:Transcriptional regulator TetR n=1 Tax=Acetobacter indonesiensis TaxID=104101 RepID=A0A6N3T590_9PROT|nr:TetR family transcriptional regulator [Acetobacter indonesiensis]GAN64222.1 transcriptional regulator TetR [Acetobacter indonesiensis]GBQ53048.1 TetR family transcriptional regulator [Acetobacter indonesiensis NRIC 0313]GEN03098.1 hypothetical protein AIN02nite_11230 [Acetobacter indonesiensis]
MDTDDFDVALLSAAMTQAEQGGWNSVSLLESARQAGLPLAETRDRFPCRASLLLRLGRIADESALADDTATGDSRERLFDLLMRRLDVFQQYRNGIKAVMRALPFDPALAVILGGATIESMRWMADAAGISTTGLGGIVRINLVMGVWTHTLRTWEKDDSEDMGSTMAALDQALDKAARFKLFPTGAGSLTDGGLPDVDFAEPQPPQPDAPENSH